MSIVRTSRLLLVAAAVGCGGASRQAAPVATDHVALPPSYLFAPAAITVPVGTKVTWTSTDHFTHSVRLLDDGSKVMILRPGDSTSFSFTTPGVHRYDCSFHAHDDMHGTVTVTPAP